MEIVCIRESMLQEREVAIVRVEGFEWSIW